MRTTAVQTKRIMGARDRLALKVSRTRACAFILCCTAGTLVYCAAIAIACSARSALLWYTLLGVGVFGVILAFRIKKNFSDRLFMRYKHELDVIEEAEKVHEALGGDCGWSSLAYYQSPGGDLPGNISYAAQLCGSPLLYRLYQTKRLTPDAPGEWRAFWHTRGYVVSGVYASV
jgi:hypothetical protein